jgi:hypothetical protein
MQWGLLVVASLSLASSCESILEKLQGPQQDLGLNLKPWFAGFFHFCYSLQIQFFENFENRITTGSSL